jgi:O-antigen/teichoic acid export membrane protein
MRIRWASAFTIAAVALLLSEASASEQRFPIFYQGADPLVLGRLELDPSTIRVDNLAAAQVAIFQDQLPAPGTALDDLKARVGSGLGLLIVMGPHIDAASLQTLTNDAVTQTGVVDAPMGPRHAAASEKIAATIAYLGPKSDSLATQVSWNAAVRVYERTLLAVATAATVLVATTSSDPVHSGTPILTRVRVGRGTLYVLNVWLSEGDLEAGKHSYRLMLLGAHSMRNYDFQRFFFFNYLLYCITRDAAGIAPVKYGNWSAAPVPGVRTTAILCVLIALMFAGLLAGFSTARKYSMRHPDAAARFYRPRPANLAPSSLGAAALPQAGEAKEPKPRNAGWEIIGFHRPLSGFIFNYLLNIALIIPFNFVVSFWLDRTFVNPFLEARGAGGAVAQVLLFLIPLLDLGTSQSTVKYFAEYRVRDPARAMSYVQFFIWFHLGIGLVAFAIMSLVGAVLLPHSAAAYLSWLVVIYTFASFPSFYVTFLAIFRSYQRFDYVQLTTVMFYVAYPAVQMVCAIYGRHWGLIHPAFGEGMGAVMGFAVGAVIGHYLLGLVCAIFYHRSGMKLLTLVLVHFDHDTVRKSLIYGVKATAGAVMPFLSWSMVPIILGRLIPNFLEQNELWLLTYGLSFAYLETSVSIFATMMPSISEAYSHQMIALTQRYADQGLRWAIMLMGLLGGVYVAFSPVLIGGLLPPQFGRALAVLGLMHLFRLSDFAVRMPDQFFLGAGRTGTYSWLVGIEHVGRIALTYLFVAHFGFYGLFYGFTLSATLKALVAWPLMARMVVPPVFSWWQTFVNPILAGVANYLIVSGIVSWLWRGPGHVGNTWMVLMLCLVGSFPVYFFISGLLGWDESEMQELRDAVDLVPSPFRGLAMLGYNVTQLGTRLSPLHDRFPAKLADGITEAATLTSLKAELH